MITFVRGRTLRTSLVASIPSRFGSSTSMIRTSGSRSLTTPTTSRPSPASPTISTMGELAMRDLIASRTISWSSQRTTRLASRTLELLAVLDQGDDRAPDGAGGAVQGVDRAGRLPLSRAVTRAEAAGLVVGRVRARGQLAIAALARDPGLAVVLLRRRGAEVADGDVDDAVGDLERAEDPLLDRQQAFVLRRRGGRVDEREHLDLVELVDAEDATGVAPGRACLATEAGREGAVAEGQGVGVEDLVGVQAGEGDLRGAGEEEVVLGDLIDLVAVAGEEAGSLQRLFADQDRRHHRLVPLGPDRLDREADQGQLEQDEVALQVGEARAG